MLNIHSFHSFNVQLYHFGSPTHTRKHWFCCYCFFIEMTNGNIFFLFLIWKIFLWILVYRFCLLRCFVFGVFQIFNCHPIFQAKQAKNWSILFVILFFPWHSFSTTHANQYLGILLSSTYTIPTPQTKTTERFFDLKKFEFKFSLSLRVSSMCDLLFQLKIDNCFINQS